jgi:purine-binding chemotaxis protein CheW
VSTPGSAPADPIVELCAFGVGDEEYVIDIRRMREIAQPLPIVSVPRAPEWMEGVADLRGEVVPVLDVRRRLGLPRTAVTRRTKLLVVHVAGRILALLVDRVCEVIRIPRSQIGPPPAMDAGSGARLFLGVCGARQEPAKAPIRRGRDDGAPVRAAPPPRLRLLLNVKALLEPSGRVRGARTA